MHSVVSASSPLIITLRHIFTDDALPISAENTFMFGCTKAIAAMNAAAWSPPSSMGERMPFGGTLAITAASTYRPPACVTIVPPCCFTAGETEFTSTTSGPCASAPFNDSIASSTDPAVTHTNTTSAPATAAAGVSCTIT